MIFFQILRIIFGTIYVLFLPGFIFSFIFFRVNIKEIDWFERIIISIALSMAIVPLMVFIFNLCGIAITTVNVFLEILCLILISLGGVYIRGKKKKL